MHEIWIEAESFRDLGGWVVDSGSMETLHSAYVMAHGMGTPVPDAKTEFSVPADGATPSGCAHGITPPPGACGNRSDGFRWQWTVIFCRKFSVRQEKSGHGRRPLPDGR